MLLEFVDKVLLLLSLFTADSLASWRQEQYSPCLRMQFWLALHAQAMEAALLSPATLLLAWGWWTLVAGPGSPASG